MIAVRGAAKNISAALEAFIRAFISPLIRAFIHFPALAALLIFAASCIAALSAGLLCSIYLSTPFDPTARLTELVVAEALVAATTTWRLGLARWWIAIQLLFAPALVAVDGWHLPPMLFLGVFVLLVSLYWSTFMTQVPLYPSGKNTWDAVARLLPTDVPFRFADIGSGLGGLVIDLARRRPGGRFIGVEVAPLAWLGSWIRARLNRSSASLVRQSYERLDLTGFDFVFAYLSPAAMPALWTKACREMRPGALLISFEFPVDGAPSSLSIDIPRSSGKQLFVWKM